MLTATQSCVTPLVTRHLDLATVGIRRGLRLGQKSFGSEMMSTSILTALTVCSGMIALALMVLQFLH